MGMDSTLGFGALSLCCASEVHAGSTRSASGRTRGSRVWRPASGVRLLTCASDVSAGIGMRASCFLQFSHYLQPTFLLAQHHNFLSSAQRSRVMQLNELASETAYSFIGAAPASDISTRRPRSRLRPAIKGGSRLQRGAVAEGLGV